MGYTTEFEGQFNLNKPLKKAHKNYLEAFADTRRMKRSDKCVHMPDVKRKVVKLPIGTEGEYFTGGLGFAGQDDDDSILDYNSPASTQPSLWCKWVPNEDGTAIVWNGMEKFYGYADWIKYLVKNFLEPWGYKVNGTVTWQGESYTDRGEIVIQDNTVSLYQLK